MKMDRFEELLSGLLDDELSTDEMEELVGLAKDDLGRQLEIQRQLEAAELIALSEDELRDASVFVSAIQNRVGGDPFVSHVQSGIRMDRRYSTFRRFIPWLVAVAALLVFSFVSLVWNSDEKTLIATLVETHGPVQWIGDGGQVIASPETGMHLGGGTLSTMSPDSWGRLRFADGSTLTLAGQSTLTISESEQKELRLTKGSLSASVAPQPKGWPMLVYTPMANLQVVGTEFDVVVEAASMTMVVTEGMVQTTRLSDKSVVNVPANHQVVATVESRDELEVIPLPESVRTWKSQLPEGIIEGLWLPEWGGRSMGLRGTPQVREIGNGKPTVVYQAAGAISAGAQIVSSKGATIIIRGKTDTPANLNIGLTFRYPTGGFAGKYIATRWTKDFSPEDGYFELEVPLKEFVPLKTHLPDSIAGLVMGDWWCSTHSTDAGLSLFSVELKPAELE